MNALIKKEIRLLLPSWVAILLLSTILPWVWTKDGSIISVMPAVSFFGTVLIALDSFGREFSLGIFSSLMSQPVERREIWRNKIRLLVIGVAVIFVAELASYELWFHFRQPMGGETHFSAFEIRLWRGAMIAVVLVALSGGLWTVLLIRQTAAAFWITILAPAGILMLVVLVVPANGLSDGQIAALLFILAAIYSAAGFWLAHWLFHRAQDVAWTGGVIDFSRWRYFERKDQSSISRRECRPFVALVKKEFQLHSVSLIGAGALLVLHIGVLIMRAHAVGAQKNIDSFTGIVSGFFWIFWLALPLVLGSMAVAEERKLGVMDGQFCLPVSRWRQFVLKFFPVLIFGTLLGGVMPVLLETIAGAVGLSKGIFRPANHPGNEFIDGYSVFLISFLLLAAGLTAVSFLASTLTKNFLQAISLAIASCLLIFTLLNFTPTLGGNDGSPVAAPVVLLFAIPVIPSVLLWLAWRNFSRFIEGWRLWRRNVLAATGAIAFIAASSAFIFNRAWEIFQPAEPAHGAAKMSLTNPPTLQVVQHYNLLVRVPDGRVWYAGLEDFYNGYDGSRYGKWKYLFQRLLNPLPKSGGPQQFVAGSNWVTAVTEYACIGFRSVAKANKREVIWGYLDTVGIQSDGTLWVSDPPEKNKWSSENMRQFGGETNWQQLAVSRSSVVLLKNNGTLWQWGDWESSSNTWGGNWPGLRAFTPLPIGTNAAWKELFTLDGFYVFARQTDGQVWRLDVKNVNAVHEMGRVTNYDAIVSKTASRAGDDQVAFVRPDGTLWVLDQNWHQTKHQNATAGMLQVGEENCWRTVAVNYHMMVALKTDGTLWQWDFTRQSAASAVNLAPTRLGIHQDWVGIINIWGGVIACAADGSLWLWPDRKFYDYGAVIKLPKQPQLLGNVFSQAN